MLGGTCGRSFIRVRLRAGTSRAQDRGRGPAAGSKGGSVHVTFTRSSRPFLQAADVQPWEGSLHNLHCRGEAIPQAGLPVGVPTPEQCAGR